MGGASPVTAENAGYLGLYHRFATLIAVRTSDVYAAPLRLVTDALLIGERTELPAFAV